MRAKELTISVDDAIGSVSGLLVRPRGARWLYLMAHGAGVGMHSNFMVAMAEKLYRRQVATLRYQFPYMEAGRKRPDHKKRLVATVRAAVATARDAVRLPLLAGGKSMGGRMTSTALAERPEPAVSGLVFLGFPLHPAGKPGIERAEHLRELTVPMLFLQGSRDALADLELMGSVLDTLRAQATEHTEPSMHVTADGDHSFKVPRRSGRTDDQVLDELADTIAAFGQRVFPGGQF